MKSAVMVQIRLGSSRLPQKALLPIEGEPMVSHVLRALKRVEVDTYLLVCPLCDVHILQPYAHKEGFEVFGGDEHDVLLRYLEGAKANNIDLIVRATGDNPLVCFEAAQKQVNHLLADSTIDYCTTLGMIYGTGVEVFKTECLEKANQMSLDPYDHEHVTPYIYKNIDNFKIDNFLAPCPLESRVTIDTEEDYQRVKQIFSQLYNGKPIAYSTLCDYLTSHDTK